MSLLTILIPTIPSRAEQFFELFHELQTQVQRLPDEFKRSVKIEYLLTDAYKDGGISVGTKRQKLFESVESYYFCFIDDDERPSPNYVEQLVRLCMIGADVVTFKSIYKCDNYWGIANMSLHHPTNEQATPFGEFKRRPFHVCPVKTEKAKACEFPDINNAEDWAFMDQVLKHCTTEVHTEQILHQYNHSAKTSAVDNIP